MIPGVCPKFVACTMTSGVRQGFRCVRVGKLLPANNLQPRASRAFSRLSSRASESKLGLRVRTRVPHVENHLPASILLQFPDAGIFSVLDDGLAIFVLRMEFVVA